MPFWLCDVDGTLALHNNRDPYRWQDATSDALNVPVHRVVSALADRGDSVIFLSGRPEEARLVTETWLTSHFHFAIDLRLRASGDNRPDPEVKADLYRQLVAERGPASGVFDDRQRVVDMWRNDFGLICFQVADGHF